MRLLKRVPPAILLTALVLLAVLLSLAIGSVRIPLLTVVRVFYSRLTGIVPAPGWPDSYRVILTDLRLPRTLLVAMTGAALAGSGAAYQGLFRNPLADPFLIGVASGAGLGAVVAMGLRWPAWIPAYMAVPFAALLTGLLTVLAVYTLARVGRSVPITNLLLSGVTVSSFCTALSSFLMLRSQGQLRQVIAWLFGGVTTSSWEPVLGMLPYTLLGLGLLLTTGHALNVMQFGEEQASQMGLDTHLTRLVVVLGSTLAAASAVAFSGIIGFIGLIVPHIIRLLWGGDYRRILPLSILGGMAALLFTDILARVIMPPQEIPLSIITMMVGAPFFLWIFRRTKQQAFW